MAEDLTVLIIGSAAREDTISHAYEKSRRVKKILVAPGNDFIGWNREKEVTIDKGCSLKDPQSLLEVARKYKPDLVEVAQDDALALGTVHLMEENGFLAFGPTKEAAEIEWNKAWSRDFMQRREIPHPGFRAFSSEDDGIRYVEELYREDLERLVYVKAAGLCAGKGALKSTSLQEATENIRKMKGFPDGAGSVFLVEEGATGEEFSYYAIVDGKTYRVTNSAQDNKTVRNFDEGEQTGGMGAISPAMVTEPIEDQIIEQMVAKAVNGMAAEGRPYKGILYVGGMATGKGPTVIEYNARWGDPEVQVVLPALADDYADVVMACMEGRLGEMQLHPDDKVRVCVVGASRGYPGDYSAVKGKRIYGLEDAMQMDGVTVYGAGIAVRDGKFYASGGRLFNVVGEGHDIMEAKERAYAAMACVNVGDNGLHYRTDIGWRDVQRHLRTLE